MQYVHYSYPLSVSACSLHSQCIPYPDHRQSLIPEKASVVCEMIRSIPKEPKGMNLAKAILQSRNAVPRAVRDFYEAQNETRRDPKQKSWTRLNPDRLFPTIICTQQPGDARLGPGLHWNQHRFLTILEARRAQGFPDYEPIIGSVTAQWRIVGNSVARSVSLALGMSLREAWLSHPPDVIERFTTEPNVERNEAELFRQGEVWSSPMVVITRRTVEASEPVVLKERHEARSDLPVDVLPPQSTAEVPIQTRTSVLEVRTGPIVVIPRKTTHHVDSVAPSKGSGSSIFTQMSPSHHSVGKQAGIAEQHHALSTSNGLAKCEPKRRKGWKGWVEIEEDKAPQVCSDVEISSEAGYSLRTRTARSEGYSIDNAITIEDSDSDDKDSGVEDILPRTTSSIPLPEPAAPWRPGRAEAFTKEAHPPIPLPQPSAPWRPSTTIFRQRVPTERGQKTNGDKRRTVSIPFHTSRTRSSRYVVPGSESESEGERQESMFVPFRMFSSQTPNLIFLDSDSESEDASVIAELPFRDQPQRMVATSTPARIHIDLDELDD